MKTALVIVDAFKEMFEDDETKDANAFCHFLNRVCDVERKKGTVIIHSVSHNQKNSREKDPSGNPITEASPKTSLNENINFHQDDIFTDAINLYKTSYDNNIDKLYFAGFFFGKCIFAHLREARTNCFKVVGSVGGEPVISMTRDYKTKNNIFDCNNIVLNLSMILPKHSWLHHINRCNIQHNYYLWGPNEFELLQKGTDYEKSFEIRMSYK